MLYRGVFSIAWQSFATHEFQTVGELVGTLERESSPLNGCNVVGRPNEELLSFSLDEFTVEVVTQPLRITDIETGKTWQGNYVLGQGGNRLRLVSAGDVRET